MRPSPASSLLFVLLAGCAAPRRAPPPDVGWMVRATLTAIAAEGPAVSATGGGIEGQVLYPAEARPALRIVAFQVATGQTYSVETAPGQTSYRPGGPARRQIQRGGLSRSAATRSHPGWRARTQAVLCGLGAECTEHGLVDVIVFEGEITSGVDILD